MERVTVQFHIIQNMSLWGPSNLRIRERVRAEGVVMRLSTFAPPNDEDDNGDGCSYDRY